MQEFPMQKVTIYHKTKTGYERYVIDVSFRNISNLNREKNGVNSSDNAIIRIFDVENYNKNLFINTTTSNINCSLNSFSGTTWKIQIEDIVVNGAVNDDVTFSTAKTELSKKYGKHNVFKITSINLLIFNDEDIEELNHVKLGCI